MTSFNAGNGRPQTETGEEFPELAPAPERAAEGEQPSQVAYSISTRAPGRTILQAMGSKEHPDVIMRNHGIVSYQVLFDDEKGKVLAVWGNGTPARQLEIENLTGKELRFLKTVLDRELARAKINGEVTKALKKKEKAEETPAEKMSRFLAFLKERAEKKKMGEVDLLTDDNFWYPFVMSDRVWSRQANDAFRLKVIEKLLLKSPNDKRLQEKEAELKALQSKKRWSLPKNEVE